VNIPLAHTAAELRGGLIVKEYTLQFISVFAAGNAEMAQIKASSDWEPLSVDDKDTRAFLVNNYTPEFRNVMFLDDGDDLPIRRFLRKWANDDSARFDVVSRNIPFRLLRARIFAFEGNLGGLGLYVIEVRHCRPEVRLSDLSDLGNALRVFATTVRSSVGGTELSVTQLIQSVVLPGIIVGDGSRVNQYSGSKLKTFLAVDLASPENPSVLRDLLFDLGCFSPVGSANGDTSLTPSDEYLESIVSRGVRPFRNYQALTLFDSFVSIGSNLLEMPDQRLTWDDTYLRIYVYNLYVKFRCQQLMADLHRTASRDREQCERFLVKFDAPRISYNFLPSLFHEDMRRGLEVREELEALRRRVGALSKLIDEDYQKRTAALLGVVSVLGAVQGVPTYLAYVPRIQAVLHLHAALFWLLASVLAIAGACLLGAFLFPDRLRRARQRYSRRNARRPPPRP